MKACCRFALLATLSVAACDDPAPPPPPTPAPASAPIRVTLPKLAPALEFKPNRTSQRIGLPKGCRLDLPTFRAETLGRRLRFLGTPNSHELVLAEAGSKRAIRSGILPLRAGEALRPFPWSEFDSPPPTARSRHGFIAALPTGQKDGLQTLSLWREGFPSSPLAAGDRLTPWDAACSDETCAILSTRVSKSEGAGATVFSGPADRGAATWRRVDIHPGHDGDLGPLSILEVDKASARVALASETGVEIWEAKPRGAKRLSRIDVEHEVFGVLPTQPAVVITAADPVERPCRADGMELVFVRSDGTTHGATIPVAPDGLVARRLEDGYIVAWIAPLSCRLTDRFMVHAILVDDEGRPRGGPMAVSDASGFALTTEGVAVTLWLHRGPAVSRATGTCQLPPIDPAAGASAVPGGSAFKSAPK